ncbi:hypothetical protein SBADM41S_03566 [Streptomyces badius]
MTETGDTRSADGTPGGAEREAPRSRLQRMMRYIPLAAPVLLWAVPCWILLHTGQRWPLPVALAGTALFVLGLVGMPFAMARGHGRVSTPAAIVGDTLLGFRWVLFTWSVLLGALSRLALTVADVGDGQDRARIVTWAVLGVAAVLLAWGYAEARRVPRVRRLDVELPRLGAGLDGTRVVLITDTHYGPLDRARWSARVCETVNTLEADLVCHTGDIADGTAERRRAQAAPLGTVRATRARVTSPATTSTTARPAGRPDRRHLAAARAQVVHGAPMNDALPGPRPVARRSVVLPGAARAAGREPVTPSASTPPGQTRQPLQRIQPSRSSTTPGLRSVR